MKKLQHPQITSTPFGNLPINIKDLPTHLAKTKAHDEIKIVYFGTPEFSAYILEKLIEFCGLDEKFTVQTVITRADKPAGRKQEVKEPPVAMIAKKYNIPTLKPTKLDEDFITAHLSLLTCDLIIVASYGKIIPQALLDIPTIGSLNVHGSILPKYRGASPIQSAILNGDKETGVTIMLMDAEMDHGPILSAKEFSLSEKETYVSLSTKMSQVAVPLLIETMVKFVEGKIKPKPQNHQKATFCKLLKKEVGFFDINNPPSPQQLDRMIRAYYPWPGVWSKWHNKIVKFYPEGKIHPDLIGVQMEGKKAIPLKDFLNGYPDFPIH
ncbi:methionyl-tRNA formyltransferase [Candidatus Daviesbacteria bacterium]|nr:methionyl-tRNA formyltransferase [Candidatus Daviesbacteria bacterium]